MPLALVARKHRVAVGTFDYLLAGTYYNHAALVAGYTLPAGTIPINQWGVYRVSIQASGTVTVTRLNAKDYFGEGAGSASTASGSGSGGGGTGGH